MADNLITLFRDIFGRDPLGAMALVVILIGMLGLLYLSGNTAISGNVELLTKIIDTMKDTVLLVLGFYFGRSRQETKE